MSRAAQRRAAADLTILAASVLSGMAIALCALFMRTAKISAASIVTAPAGALVFCYRDAAFARRAAIIITAINAVIDAAVLFDAAGLRAQWQLLPIVVSVWASFWIFWQLPPAFVAARRAIH